MLAQLQVQGAERFVEDIRTTRSQKTRDHYAGALRSFGSWLKRTGRWDCDPFAGLPSPTVAGTCGPATINPLPPGCYTTIPGTITNFTGGGIYKVTGLIDITSSLAGSNMLLYLTSTASINGGNNGTLTISAGNTAPYAGIAIYGDAGSQINAGNAFELNITGALYMPDSDLTFNNHLQIDNTNCTLIIVNSLDIDNGNSQILNTSGCAGSFSNAAFLGVAISE